MRAAAWCSATEAGREKRVEAQRRWRVAQEGVNATLGRERVIALHALIDEAMRRTLADAST